MRKIKFRAKGIGTGEWVYGYYVETNCGRIIEENGVVNIVDEDTVSQYTGLEDTNGFEIYEGDLLAYDNGDIKEIDEVFFDEKYGTIEVAINGNKRESELLSNVLARLPENCSYRVVGNIYESEATN